MIISWPIFPSHCLQFKTFYVTIFYIVVFEEVAPARTSARTTRSVGEDSINCLGCLSTLKPNEYSPPIYSITRKQISQYFIRQEDGLSYGFWTGWAPDNPQNKLQAAAGSECAVSWITLYPDFVPFETDKVRRCQSIWLNEYPKIRYYIAI